MMSVRIGLLGPLEVRDAAGQVRPVGGARLRSLLIRLAIGQGRAVALDTLAADLWPDGGPADAANAIQALVSRLRAAAGKDIVEHGPTGYRLSVPPDEIDARAFEDLAAAGRRALTSGDHHAAAETLRRALGMWRGPALADVADAPFAAAAITRLEELRLAATEDRIDAEFALGRGAGLVPEIEELSAGHPLRERLRGQLMRTLYAAGRQADALGVYEDTRRVLATELGIDPSPALAAVHLAILRGELPGTPAVAAAVAASPPAAAGPPGTDALAPAGPAAPASPHPSPPWGNGAAAAGIGSAAAGIGPAAAGIGPAAAGSASASRNSGGTRRRTGNLPAQLTSFVGRDDELDQVSGLLAAGRLITLTGPGGAGKTRLSVEAGGKLAGQAPDGVWFVPLAPVRDAADVPQSVLTAMGIHDTGWVADAVEAARLAALEPLDRLTDLLEACSLVLILDNCEHVLDAVATLAARVLAAAPGVRILATSREPLGLTGETLCPVPSLALPPAAADPVAAAQSPAVRLFADRAAAVRPGFAVDADTAEAVVRICRALDGIPLAIELAAARARALTVSQIADRLDDRFALLSVGARGVLPRHQTLRAIVDWSWELLDDTERAVLSRLSVFSGGATPDSAEQVCSAGGGTGPVLDVIAALVDKSLVVAAGQRHVRYGLLETVRAYAAERLAQAGEADQAAAAHAAYFLALAEQAEPHLRSHEQLVWLERMGAEHDNFAAALRHALAVGDVRWALRFVRALTWFWVMRDYDVEAVEWASEVMRLTGDDPPADLTDAYAICKLVTTVSKAASDLPGGDPQQAWDVLGTLTLPADSSHPVVAVVGPVLAMFGPDGGGARKALQAAAPHPDPWVNAARRAVAGHLALHDGEIEAAATALAEGHAMFREVGDRFGLIVSLMGQADVSVARGDPATAVQALEQAREHAGGGMASNWSEMIRIPLGRARALAGDSEGGRADLELGLRRAEQIGEFDDAVSGYLELADMARRDGDLAKAHGLLDRALAIAEPRQHRPDMIMVTAKTFSKLGCVTEQEGDLAAAAGWHERALAAVSKPSVAILPINPTLAALVEGVAALAAARGDHARAAELLGLVTALQGFTSAASLDAGRARAAATAALGEAGFQAAYANGRHLDRADALALIP
jgi:predicted ATPase/DNA-binding SARP family transcriptional activator